MIHREKHDTSEALTHLRKESLDIFNRLHSVAEDINFVDDVCSTYSNLPVMPNLRCGAWYVDPKLLNHGGAYFKSTDGHTNNWSFNLRRPNLHLLPILIQSRGIVLVDSTRSGKRMPDALSKTVPIWCAVINRAIKTIHSKDTKWNVALYCPPGVVSGQEHSQIDAQLETWVTSLVQSSYAIPNMSLPLRPLWITPSTSSFPRLPTPDKAQFIPVICVSASKQILEGVERRSQGFGYVQGSGDDHELWGMGLTPDLFWKNKEQLLSASRGSLSQLVQTLVTSSSISLCQEWTEIPTQISKVEGRLLLCPTSYIPMHFPPHVPHSHRPMAYVIISNILPALDPPRRDVLTLEMQEGKKGQFQFLHSVLFKSMPFIGEHLSKSTAVCICCHNGKDASIGVALAALQIYFDNDGLYVSCLKDQERMRKLADKKSIATRLQWIISSRPKANPSRATLKRVNEFLLTPSEFLPLPQSSSKI